MLAGDMDGVAAKIIYRARALVRPPVTLGVRFLLHDEAGRVLLVKHTYTPGWHFPGGGVDPGETARDAAVREVHEETGVEVAAPCELFGLYFNEALAKRDHVAVFWVRDHPKVDATRLSPQAMEIADVCLAPLSNLPDDLTGPTRRRLQEAFEGAPVTDRW